MAADSYPLTSSSEITAPARPRLRRSNFLREIIETLILIILVYTVVNLATVRFYIEGTSMEPNFYAGQFVLVSRVHYLYSSPERGDIIVFDAPGDDQRANNPLLIKRVIGEPGDHVEVRDGRVYVNGLALYEPYIFQDNLPTTCSNYCDVTLGADEFYMMGDHRVASQDSRAFGPVSRNRVVGEAIARYWPPADLSNVTRLAYPQ